MSRHPLPYLIAACGAVAVAFGAHSGEAAASAGDSVYIDRELHREPRADATVVARLTPGNTVGYVRQRDGWLMVQTKAGDAGWARLLRGTPREPAAVAHSVVPPVAQVTRAVGLRWRSELEAPASAGDVAEAACVRVRASSRDGHWYLVETGRQRSGWIAVADVELVPEQGDRSMPIGRGCRVAPLKTVELLARPSTTARSLASMDPGDPLRVEKLAGEWVLVETAGRERGWLRSTQVELRPEEPAAAPSGTSMLVHGMMVTPKARTALLRSSPGRRGLHRERRGAELRVLDIVSYRGDDWLLAEGTRGRFGWVRASRVRAVERGVAIVDGGAEASEDAPRIGFHGTAVLQVAVPIDAGIEANSTLYQLSMRGRVSRPFGESWVLSVWGQYRFTQQRFEDDSGATSQRRTQQFEVSGAARYFFTDRIQVAGLVGYTLSTTTRPANEGLISLESASGPILAGLATWRFIDALQLRAGAAYIYPFRLVDGEGSFRPVVSLRPGLRWFAYRFLSVEAAFQTLLAGGNVNHRIGLAVIADF